MGAWSLLDETCGCVGRSETFPVVLQTSTVLDDRSVEVHLYRTCGQVWVPCGEHNVPSEWQRELVGEYYVEPPGVLERAATLACAELNLRDEQYWHDELVSACRSVVEKRLALREHVAAMLDSQDAQLRHAQCRAALVEADLSEAARLAGWALMPGAALPSSSS